MLAELERYCCFKNEGCNWQGPNYLVDKHEKSCVHRSKELLLTELTTKDAEIRTLTEKNYLLEKSNKDLQAVAIQLTERVTFLEKKVRVYDAFFKAEGESSFKESDLQRVVRLRRLELLAEDSGKDGDRS